MNLHTIKNHKIADKKVEGPKPGLSADQFPAEVEDPITGEMKPVDGKSEKVKDAADEKLQNAFYPLVKKYVARYLPSIYPSYDGSVDDMAHQVYIRLATPHTAPEDIVKLKEEDAKNGTSHSLDWYRNKQTKYPKVSTLDKFDADKSTLEGFASSTVKQAIIKEIRRDNTLELDPETNKYKRVAMTSLDNSTMNAEGESSSPALRAVNEQYAVQPQDDGLLDTYVQKLRKMNSDQLDYYTSKIEEKLAEGGLNESEQQLLNTLLTAAKQIKGPSSYGKGGYAKSKGVKIGGAEEYPFGVEPIKVTTSSHEVRLKFPFSSKQEAQEKAEEFEDEMRDKGWVLHKVMGSSLVYKREGE